MSQLYDSRIVVFTVISNFDDKRLLFNILLYDCHTTIMI